MSESGGWVCGGDGGGRGRGEGPRRGRQPTTSQLLASQPAQQNTHNAHKNTNRSFPTATPKDLAEKLYAAPACRDSARFKRPKLSQTAFTVEHYAGPVTYQSDNFLDKNKDFVVAEHQSLLQASARPFVRELFPADPEPSAAADGAGADGAAPGPSAAAASKRFAAFKFNSVGSQFKRQLGDLMAQLGRMEPHYIRCIKPNAANAPALFEPANVLHQLRCGGVLEAVRISCAGFPNKRPFPEFVEHFWQLAPELYHDQGLEDR